jgi:hypothetical protein
MWLNKKETKMNAINFEKLHKGGVIKVRKNQVFFDESNGVFVVEQWEYDDSDGTPMYSVLDGFLDFECAMEAAENPKKYLQSIMQ